MRIGIMQPYFFPYLGYISLIKHTDRFILFDPVQFIRHGWIERNRILKQQVVKPGEDWLYISVPLLKHDLSTLIKDVKIDDSENWRGRIRAQLGNYKKRAPFYKETIAVVEKGLSIQTDSITKLNENCLRAVCGYLNLDFQCQVFSEMNLNIDTVNAPDEWALNICKAIPNVDEYWNPPGGMEFFDREKYERAGIKLVFQKPVLEFYPQRRGKENFEIGLSIIDVMMFNSPDVVNAMLDKYECL